MENPEDISITPEMLSEIDVEWLREIDSTSRSPVSGYLTPFQSVPSQRNAAVQLISNPSQQCNVLTVSAAQEGLFGDMEEDLMGTYHNMLSNETDDTSSIVDKDFMEDKEFAIEDQFMLENMSMPDNDSEFNISSNSFVDDLSEFLTFPAVSDSIYQNCFTEEDIYESAIDKMNLSKMTSLPCDPCHHLVNTTGLFEKSTLEISAMEMYEERSTSGLHETGMCDQFTTEISTYGPCEKSTTEIDTSEQCEHTATESDTEESESEVPAKSAIEMPESFIKELEEIVQLIGRENEESAHGLPSEDLNKSAAFTFGNETPAFNKRNQDDIPVESLKYETVSSVNANSLQYMYMGDSLRDNVKPLSNRVHITDHGNFAAGSDNTLIFQRNNNDTCVRQIKVYDINSNSKECCNENINLETYASVTDSCRNLLTIPNNQSEIHLPSMQECSDITNTLDLHLTQFEEDSDSEVVTSASHTNEEQCITEPNIYFPNACISSISLQDATDTPQQLIKATSSQTCCSYNAGKQSGCSSSYEQERFEKQLVECSNVETRDHESGPSFLTDLENLQDSDNVSDGIISEKETEPGISQCDKTISLLDTNLITQSCVTIKDNVKYSFKRKQVDQRAVNEFSQSEPKKVCASLDKADQSLNGRESLTDQSNDHHESSSSSQKVSIQSSPKGDMNLSAGYCILVTTIEGPKSSTLIPLNDPISCRNKPPAEHKESVSSSADHSIVFGKIEKQFGIQENHCGIQENNCGIQENNCGIQENNCGIQENQHICAHPSSVKVIRANEEPDKCTCHRVNIGMKNKYVSLLVRDMWNKSVKDLLHLSGHGSEPKSEKEIAKEMTAERNMVLKRKGKRLLFKN